MSHRCSLCGRFTRQIKDAVGFPLTTGFPPDKPNTASNSPYAPFACYNHQQDIKDAHTYFGRVEYQPVGFAPAYTSTDPLLS